MFRNSWRIVCALLVTLTFTSVCSAGNAAGQNHQQQLESFQIQLATEEARHLERVSRLEGLLESAWDRGLMDMVARLEQLMEREQQRYEQRIQVIQQRIDQLLPPEPEIEPLPE
ncbi:MAG: hypothetical protein JW936_01860 [Sedimentisphaerales bacterium]|nr:hypothetical protein [Sedimentisphaerales bacterium]